MQLLLSPSLPTTLCPCWTTRSVEPFHIPSQPAELKRRGLDQVGLEVRCRYTGYLIHERALSCVKVKRFAWLDPPEVRRTRTCLQVFCTAGSFVDGHRGGKYHLTRSPVKPEDALYADFPKAFKVIETKTPFHPVLNRLSLELNSIWAKQFPRTDQPYIQPDK